MVGVQIPIPDRFAIHKLIVAHRRSGMGEKQKAKKDLAQADFLIEVLSEMRPDDLREAYEQALIRGPGWRNRIQASLDRVPRAVENLANILD
jgi:hypothetical protein